MRKKRTDVEFVGELKALAVAFHRLPVELQFALGMGAGILGCAAMNCMTREANHLLPALVSIVFPLPSRVPPAPSIDERQLGRSEVFRAIARAKGN